MWPLSNLQAKHRKHSRPSAHLLVLETMACIEEASNFPCTRSDLQHPNVFGTGKETLNCKSTKDASTQNSFFEQPFLDDIDTLLENKSSDSSSGQTMNSSAQWDHLDLDSAMEGDNHCVHNPYSPTNAYPEIVDQPMKIEIDDAKLLEEEAKRRAPRKGKVPPVKKKSGHRQGGLPIRPLSAYNMFFRECRRLMIEDQGRPLPFADMGKEIGRKWKALDDDERLVWEKQAEADSIRYRHELRRYKDQKKKERQARFKLVDPNDHSVGNGSERKESSSRSELGDFQSNPPRGEAYGSEMSRRSKPLVRELSLSQLPSGFKIPSNFPSTGHIVEMPDSQGRLQEFTIEWKLYSVKPSKASSLMDQLKAVPAQTPHFTAPLPTTKDDHTSQIIGDKWHAHSQDGYGTWPPNKRAENAPISPPQGMHQSITATLQHQANSILGMHSHFVASLRGLE